MYYATPHIAGYSAGVFRMDFLETNTIGIHIDSILLLQVVSA